MRAIVSTFFAFVFATSAQAFCYQSGELIPCEAQEHTTQSLKTEKRTRLGLYLTAREAHVYLREHALNSLFVDIRTRGEYMYVGSPDGLDAHIPYMEVSELAVWDAKAKRYELEANSHFLPAIAQRAAAKRLSKTDSIVLICRSGDRSAKAVDLLRQAGYTQVYTVTDGFEGDLNSNGRRELNGWRDAGLPWSYPSVQQVAYQR
jgi:rhodanese-related sulfurtransferase